MTNRRRIVLLGIVAEVLIWSGFSAGGDWPQWRGPHFTGAADETNLPANWDPNGGVHIGWTVDLPGPGGATPIVWKDRVFVSSAQAGGDKLYALCYDAATGKELWRRDMGRVTTPNKRNEMAAPSPVTDGKLVVFLYGTGAIAGFDLEGEPAWSRNLAVEYSKLQLNWGHSSSPLLYQDRLYVAVLRSLEVGGDLVGTEYAPQSFMSALELETGKTVWRRPRVTPAQQEAREGYGTPIPYEAGGRQEVLLAGADWLTGWNPANGQEVWRLDYNPRRQANWRLVSTPVVGEGLVYLMLPRAGSGLWAVRPGGGGQPPEVAWKFEKYTPDVPCSLLYGGRLYVLDDNRKVMTCLNPATGQQIWQGELGGRDQYFASPLGADGKVYCMDVSGEVVVLKAGATFEVLGRQCMGGKDVRSSIIAAAGGLFIRTNTTLYFVKN